ncbi:PQQ-binding-like beta-propeller repeat protein [Streptomyces sp. NPDC014779]|uniref:outer membrane protein assembly factor BamB family protein n=1 Tax=unclassified Streptomyces TaxID=2593676 RepID=UPI0036FD5B3B
MTRSTGNDGTSTGAGGTARGIGHWARRVLLFAGVPLALVGGVGSCVAHTNGKLPGDSMERAWDTPFDANAAEHGNSAWLLGDTVVRSRYDAVTAFDATAGNRRWEYTVPGRAEICAVSRPDGGTVALVAYGEKGEEYGEPAKDKGCRTVAAIDLGDGRELWRSALLPGDAGLDGRDDLVATGGGLAVLRDVDDDWGHEPYPSEPAPLAGNRALRALDLRTGAPRWSAAVPRGCFPHRVAAAEKQVLAVLACDRTELKLAAYDPADGRQRWLVPLGTRRAVGTDARVTFLSADPTVIRVAGTEDLDVHAFLSFGQDGRPRALIEAEGPYGEIALDDPARWSLDGDTFYAAVGGSNYGDRERVVAFPLAGGEPRWESEPLESARDITAIHAERGRVRVVTRSSKENDKLYVLDAGSGKERDVRTFAEEVDRGKGRLAGLLQHGDLLVAARWGEGVQPFSAYRPW